VPRDDESSLEPPAILQPLAQATRAVGFTIASDMRTGSLLRTLAASKPAGRFLELGTGTGMGTAWILDGMDSRSTLLTVDHDARVAAVAREHLSGDPRVTFQVMDGSAFLQSLCAQAVRFDFIFADTWPGKFDHLDLALELLAPGALYVVDDLNPQPSWPADHPLKVARLITRLAGQPDLRLTRLNWSTGLIVAVKIAERGTN
jgi:predicted O-methyltransferase YrrM